MYTSVLELLEPFPSVSVWLRPGKAQGGGGPRWKGWMLWALNYLAHSSGALERPGGIEVARSADTAGQDRLRPPVDDGLNTREAGSWVKDKLAILENYYPAFGMACRKWRRWHYVDPFAGSGVNWIRGTDELVWGSALIALQTVPEFSKCLLMELGRPQVRALEARARSFGSRAVVHQGDFNVDLLPLMEREIDRRAPCLCLLDPEGMEVHWPTIEALAAFRTGRYRVELLILFQVDGLSRVMPLYTVEPWAEPGLFKFWGHEEWRPIHERRARGELLADEARTEYLKLYVKGLRKLGYTVLNREIRQAGRSGRIKYFLIFATNNKTGENIMKWCFDRVFPRDEPQVFLPGLEPPAGRAV